MLTAMELHAVCVQVVDRPLLLAATDPIALSAEGGCTGCQPGLATACGDVWL